MKPDVLKHIMYFGLMFGLIFALNFFLGTMNGMFFSVLSWVVTLAIPYVAYYLVRDCRDRVLGGTISYGQAFIYGIQLFFYASLISAAFRFVYCQWLNPDFLPNLVDTTMSIFEQGGMAGIVEASGMTMSQYADTLRSVLSPLNMAFMAIFMNFFAGLFISLITAAIVRKDKSLFDAE